MPDYGNSTVEQASTQTASKGGNHGPQAQEEVLNMRSAISDSPSDDPVALSMRLNPISFSDLLYNAEPSLVLSPRTAALIRYFGGPLSDG